MNVEGVIEVDVEVTGRRKLNPESGASALFRVGTIKYRLFRVTTVER